MEMKNDVDLEYLQTKKPQRLLEEAPPEIRNYVLSLEGQLAAAAPFEEHYNEVNTKYTELQEELFSLQVQIVEFKYKLEDLKQENDKLTKENERLNKENDGEKETSKRNKNNVLIPKRDAPLLPAVNRKRNENTDIDPNENNANSILVKGVPQELFGTNPKKGVISLGKHMNLQLTEADIRKITAKERKFYERLNMQPDKLIFIVELSNSDAKVNILKNKEKLKANARTKNIEITDFVSEDVYNLYQYAKVLKTYGYHLVYWRNNSVYAKKTRSSNSTPILIESTNQVDVLKEIK